MVRFCCSSLLNFPNSIETQQQIVNQLDQLQEQTNLLVTKYKQKLANLEELKKSILEKAFKGELITQKIEV
jgi:type I restriction enzyme S subunit